VRARGDLPDDELAIACASHRDTPEQVAAVRALLARAEATEDDLELGLQEDRPPRKIHHNCSGKHAGMLALCRAHGWPTQGYHLPEHPVQRACHEAHAEAAEAEPEEAASDGCGVVTFALPLERMAHAYSRLETLPGGDRIAAGMRARPDLVGGPDGADFFLMRAAPGWVAKGGAEGLLCAAGPDGIGVALKAEDGAGRGHRPALAVFLKQLGFDLPDLAEVPVFNSRGERVGEVVAAAG
jgi:L-asparaginase II